MLHTTKALSTAALQGKESQIDRNDDLPKIGAPATRALANIGVTRLSQATEHTEGELLALHGFGPRAMRILSASLAEAGLSFANTADVSAASTLNALTRDRGGVSTVLIVAAFASLWAGAALLLSCVPWFERPLRHPRRSLAERLGPYVVRGEIDEVASVQRWLDRGWHDTTT